MIEIEIEKLSPNNNQ